MSFSKILSFIGLLAFIIMFNSCKVYKTPYGQSFVEYVKPAVYNKIDYSFLKGDNAVYLENMKLNRTYVLWLSHVQPLQLPSPSELPEGYVITKVQYSVAANFSLNYRKEVRLINDNHQNVYMRIH